MNENGYLFLLEWGAGFTIFLLFLTALPLVENNPHVGVREQLLCSDIASVWTYHPEGLIELLQEWKTGSVIQLISDDAELEQVTAPTETFNCTVTRKTLWGSEKIVIRIQAK